MVAASSEIHMCNFLRVFPCWSSLVEQSKKNDSSQWKIIHVNVREPNGTLKMDKDEKKKSSSEKPLVLSLVQDLETGDLYTGDNLETVATKCAWLFIGTPFYTIFYIGWYLGRIPVAVASLAIQAIQKFGQDWAEKTVGEALCNLLTTFFWEIPKEIASDVWNIIRAPFHAIALMFATLYGVIANPYTGRKYVSMVERSWQHYASWKEDFQAMKSPEEMGCWEAFVNDAKKAKSCYFAHCMTIRGNINTPTSESDPTPIYVPIQGSAAEPIQSAKS